MHILKSWFCIESWAGQMIRLSIITIVFYNDWRGCVRIFVFYFNHHKIFHLFSVKHYLLSDATTRRATFLKLTAAREANASLKKISKIIFQYGILFTKNASFPEGKLFLSSSIRMAEKWYLIRSYVSLIR